MSIVPLFEQNDVATNRRTPMVQVFSFPEVQSSETIKAENEGKAIGFCC